MSYTRKGEEAREMTGPSQSLNKTSFPCYLFLLTSFWIAYIHQGQKFAMSNELSLAAISLRILEKLGSSKWKSLRESAVSSHQPLHYLHNSQEIEQEDLASHPFTMYQRDSRDFTLTLMSISCSTVIHTKQEGKLWAGTSPFSIDSYQKGEGLQQKCIGCFC